MPLKQITSSKVHPGTQMKEGEWRFAAKPRRLFHKFFGVLHEFWAGEPLFADGSNRMRGALRFEKGGLTRNHIRIAAPSWHPGVSGPAESDVGIFHTLAFDKDSDDESHYVILVPFKMKAGTTIKVEVDWCYTGAQNNGIVCWGLEYLCLAEGETVAGSTTTRTETTAGSHLTGKLIRTEFTTGIAGAVSDDLIGLHLYRDVSGEVADPLTTDVEMIAVHFHFIMDKLGQPLG